MAEVIVLIAISVAIFAGLPILLMWIAGRFAGTRTAIAIGFLTTAFTLYSIVSLNNTCNAAPICPAPGGTGACVFPCDAPVAVYIYAFIWLAGPISVALLAAATLLKFLQFRRERYV